MGKRKRSGKSRWARISVATTTTTTTPSSMPSQSVPSINISHYDNSTVPSDHGELSIGPLDHQVPESVPSLDRDLSTDLASDYLSTADDSSLGVDDDDSVVEPGVGMDAVPADAASVYAGSRYPAVPASHRTETLDGDDETIGSTRSLNPLDLQYVFENGRRYCGSYFMPNDDDEQIRLHLQHQVFLRTFDGRLTSVSLEDPTHILDIGTGVGDWAMGMATIYPDCDVVGTDISNIFAREAPINCNWEVDDAELEWHRPPDYYDLIHLRAMAGAFKDWNYIYKSAFTCLKPGGWLEILDFHDHRGEGQFYSFFDPDSIILKLDRDFREASIMSGRPRNMDHLEPRLLVNLGYTDVQCTEHAIPFRTEDGELGKLWLVTVLEALEANGIRLLTKYKGWDPEEVRRGCWQIGQEMLKLARSPKKGKDFVMKIRILKGRKPGDYEHWSTIPASETASETGSITADMSGNGGDRDSYTDVESGYVSSEHWASYPKTDNVSAMNSELHRQLVEYDRSVALSSSGIFGVENKATSQDGNMDLSSDQSPQPSRTLDAKGTNDEANDEVTGGPEANAPRGGNPSTLDQRT